MEFDGLFATNSFTWSSVGKGSCGWGYVGAWPGSCVRWRSSSRSSKFETKPSFAHKIFICYECLSTLLRARKSCGMSLRTCTHSFCQARHGSVGVVIELTAAGFREYNVIF